MEDSDEARQTRDDVDATENSTERVTEEEEDPLATVPEHSVEALLHVADPDTVRRFRACY